MTHQDFEKIVHVGKTRDCGELYARIKYEGGKLSITGVEGPKRNGDARGGCGQTIMSPRDIVKHARGWSPETVAKFREIWERWHLNDMRPYSPEMREAGWHEKAHGYGSKRWKEDVPGEVLAWLHQLPDTDIEPAWV